MPPNSHSGLLHMLSQHVLTPAVWQHVQQYCMNGRHAGAITAARKLSVHCSGLEYAGAITWC